MSGGHIVPLPLPQILMCSIYIEHVFIFFRSLFISLSLDIDILTNHMGRYLISARQTLGEGGCAPSNEAHSYNIYLIFHACTAPHSFNFVTNIIMQVVPCDPFTDIAIEITHLIIFAPSHFRAISFSRGFIGSICTS